MERGRLAIGEGDTQAERNEKRSFDLASLLDASFADWAVDARAEPAGGAVVVWRGADAILRVGRPRGEGEARAFRTLEGEPLGSVLEVLREVRFALDPGFAPARLRIGPPPPDDGGEPEGREAVPRGGTQDANGRLPVFVLTGFLGSGKTTLAQPPAPRGGASRHRGRRQRAGRDRHRPPARRVRRRLGGGARGGVPLLRGPRRPRPHPGRSRRAARGGRLRALLPHPHRDERARGPDPDRVAPRSPTRRSRSAWSLPASPRAWPRRPETSALDRYPEAARQVAASDLVVTTKTDLGTVPGHPRRAPAAPQPGGRAGFRRVRTGAGRGAGSRREGRS